MKIDNYLVQDGPQEFYDESFRATLEALIPTYRVSIRTTQQQIPPNYGIIYGADLFGLLTTLKVLPCYHWFIMRLNNFTSPRDFDQTVLVLNMPNISDLTSALMTWKTTQVIKT